MKNGRPEILRHHVTWRQKRTLLVLMVPKRATSGEEIFFRVLSIILRHLSAHSG